MDRLGRRNSIPTRRSAERLPEIVERRADAPRGRGVTREKGRLEIGERGGSAVSERDGLLDLEIANDGAVLDTTPVHTPHMRCKDDLTTTSRAAPL